MASVDSAAPEQLDFVGSLLVADTRAFVEAWREALASELSAASPQVSELRERSKTLQLRARAAGVGGLAHHLGVCNEHAESGDRERLEHCLANVLELAWQLSQELERSRPEPAAASGAAPVPAADPPSAAESEVRSSPQSALVPPPLLSNPWPGWKRLSSADVARARLRPALAELDAPPESTAPPTEVSPPPMSVLPSVEALSVPSSVESEPAEREQSQSVPSQSQSVPSQPSSSSPSQSSPEAEEEAPLSEPVPSSRSVFAEPVLESGWLDEAGAAASPQPDALSPAQQSAAQPPAAPLQAQPEALPPEALPPEALPPEALPPEALPPEGLSPESLAPEAAPAGALRPPAIQLEVERPRSGPPRPARQELAQRVAELTGRRSEPAAAPLVQPPALLGSLAGDTGSASPDLSASSGALPAPPAGERPPLLSEPAGLEPRPSPARLEISAPLGAFAPLEVSASPRPPEVFASPRPPEPLSSLWPSSSASADEELTDQDLEIRLERVRRAGPFPLGRGEVSIELPPPSEARFVRRAPRARLWWLRPLALGVLGGVALLALLLRPWREDIAAPPGTPQALAHTQALLPVQRLTDDREARLTLLALVQGGGKESNELADLIQEEVAIVAKALVEPCVPGSPSCRLAEQARQMLEQPPLDQAPPPPPAPLSGWLQGLRQPLIGVKDDPRVQKLVDYHTSDPVGRELFQGLLFRCGAYHGLFADTLTQHGLPLDLIAVPMVESGCVLDAESPVGARGLWQFMPATARAYHLRVQAGVLDERLNPIKATDAALEFLRDLRSKLGSWELALASYNMGPFALVSRINRAGPGTDFWDLVNAQRLPLETANYVPRIEAYALILANLEHFRFDAAQQALGASSTPMSVPAGTRLGQVARAVGSSATRIRELNPDLLADIVPGQAGEEFTLRVPSDGAPRAREALERLVARADDADECVPANFDWGKQRLTKAMLSRCKR